MQRERGIKELKVWSDANRARDQSKRGLRTSATLSLDSELIAWTLRLHSALTVSTSEVKFNKLADTVPNTSWMSVLLHDPGQPREEHNSVK